MIAVVFVAIGILLSILSLAFKQRTSSLVTLSLVGLGLCLLALILFFIETNWREDDTTLSILWKVLGLIGFVCSLIAFRKKTGGGTQQVSRK